MICSSCKEDKGLENFFKNSSRKSGYGHYCKICQHKHYRLYAKKNPDKIRAYSRKNERRRNQLKRNIKEVYTISDEETTYKLFGRRCFKCGKEEDLNIDHFYPLSKGHALKITNAVVLCGSCNKSKGAKDPLIWYGPLLYTAVCVRFMIYEHYGLF